jgi:hypothetical protein
VLALDSTYSLENLPQSIWIPKFSTSSECYHGSPLEMLQGLAAELGPSVGIDEAIMHLLEDMVEQGIEITLPAPSEAPRTKRAALLILVLLLTGYAREVPQA